MESIKNLNVDPELVDLLKDIEKSFGVERDIKSGSMLAHDEETINKMHETRMTGLQDLADAGGIDNMLAFEKVFVNGIGEPDGFNSHRDTNLKRIDRIIEGFNLIRDNDGKEYKAKVEEMQAKGEWKTGSKGLPVDDCHKDFLDHIEHLQNGVDGTQGKEAATLQMEHSTYSERLVMVESLAIHYENFQSKALGIEKDLGRTKQAGAELAP